MDKKQLEVNTTSQTIVPCQWNLTPHIIGTHSPNCGYNPMPFKECAAYQSSKINEQRWGETERNAQTNGIRSRRRNSSPKWQTPDGDKQPNEVGKSQREVATQKRHSVFGDWRRLSPLHARRFPSKKQRAWSPKNTAPSGFKHSRKRATKCFAKTKRAANEY